MEASEPHLPLPRAAVPCAAAEPLTHLHARQPATNITNNVSPRVSSLLTYTVVGHLLTAHARTATHQAHARARSRGRARSACQFHSCAAESAAAPRGRPPHPRSRAAGRRGPRWRRQSAPRRAAGRAGAAQRAGRAPRRARPSRRLRNQGTAPATGRPHSAAPRSRRRRPPLRRCPQDTSHVASAGGADGISVIQPFAPSAARPALGPHPACACGRASGRPARAPAPISQRPPAAPRPRPAAAGPAGRKA